MRDAFAGVTDSSRNGDGCDLSCCVYGRGCTVFADTDLAASLEAGQHLQAWLGDTSVMDLEYERYRDLNSDSSSGGASPEEEPPACTAAGISIYKARLLESVLDWYNYSLRIHMQALAFKQKPRSQLHMQLFHLCTVTTSHKQRVKLLPR